MGYSQFIKVYNVIHENPLTCAIDEETRAEDIVIDLCKKLNIKPVARHLFSLCIRNSKEWVMPFVKLVKSETEYFDFRLRFKIPDFSKLKDFDLGAHNYYFHQARYDLLSSKVSEINYEDKKRELLGMGVADMYRVILETGVARDAVVSDYKKFIPKEIYDVHLFFCKSAMHKKLDMIIDSCNQGKKLDRAPYVKDLYLKQLEDLAPNYLCEEYRAYVNEAGVTKRVNIHINPYDTKFPGIKCLYDGQKDWVQVCSIEELCFITVRSDRSMEIARKNGIPIYFNFSSTTSMFSLVSLLDGYYRLGVNWTFSLSKDLLTPSLERLRSIKCHGPVGGQFSYRKLEKQPSKEPGCYILRESELAYDQYYLDVCIKNGSKPKTYKIEKCLAGNGWCFNGEEKPYKSIQDLLKDLRTPDITVKLEKCLPPSERDVSPLLLCSVDKDPYKADDGDNSLQELLSAKKLCVFIDPKELLLYNGNTKKHKGRISIVYQGMWQHEERKRNKMTKVDIAFKVFKSDQHSIEEQLGLMGQWASVQNPALVRLYGLTFCSPRGLVMELLPLGPLDVYLRQHSHQVMDVDLVEAANYLATALWNLEEAGVVHGNVRCHKLLVAAHTDSSFVVRLADPGLTRSYTDNDVHWLAPEFYRLKNNAVKSTAADIWAFGTTLWEIFSKGQQPSEKDVDADKKQYEDSKEMYVRGRRLKGPIGCPKDLYQLMQQCWTLDPQCRKKTQEALRDINRLLYQEFNSRRHSYSVVKPPGPSNKQWEFPEDHTTITDILSMGSGDSQPTESGETFWLLDKSQESAMFSPPDLATSITSLDSVSSIQCILELEADCNVVLQGIIGQGFYGEVYRGILYNPDKYGEQQEVAVKRLKAMANNMTTDHLDNFESEINIMKRLKHENIVEIKAVIREPEVSLVMEYILHGSLQCYLTINRDRLTHCQLLKFALDVAKGMDYLGQKKIVHRDLAARNILVASETQVKISDFGLAQVMDSKGYYFLKTYRALPIKWYAPESLQDGEFSTRSDMWSYGVTLFEMFSLGEDPQLPSLGEHSTDQARLLGALKAGVRLPCPATCLKNIYNPIYTTIIHPCWLYESHSRPTFKAIAQAIDQLNEKFVTIS